MLRKVQAKFTADLGGAERRGDERVAALSREHEASIQQLERDLGHITSTAEARAKLIELLEAEMAGRLESEEEVSGAHTSLRLQMLT